MKSPVENRAIGSVPPPGPTRSHRTEPTSIRSKLRRLMGLGGRLEPPGSVRVGDRFRSGERCPVSGVYLFDGYVNEPTPSPLPLLRDWVLHLRRGDRFPAFDLLVEDAYWTLEHIAPTFETGNTNAIPGAPRSRTDPRRRVPRLQEGSDTG